MAFKIVLSYTPPSPEASLEGENQVIFQFCSSNMNDGKKAKYLKWGKLDDDLDGKIHEGFDLETGEKVTLKITKSLRGYGILATSLREVSILCNLSESTCNVVRLRGVDRRKNKFGALELQMVFDCMKSTLFSFIKTHQSQSLKIPPLVIKKIMYELLKGVASIHGHGVMHRCLTPDNIWIEKADEEFVSLKISRFALGRSVDLSCKAYTPRLGVRWYLSPELLLGDERYSLSVDMWNVGCIFAELLRRKPLFTGYNEFEMLTAIFEVLGTPNEKVWPGVSHLRFWHIFPQWEPTDLRVSVPDLDMHAFDLLSKLLEYNPSKRISAKRALLHPYFSELITTKVL